ncbi:hypothetical protein XENOCAPTIV_018086, partial [Xenoophorus captivus]
VGYIGMGGPVSVVSFCPFRRYNAHPPSTFLSKVRIKKTLASGRPKFSLTVKVVRKRPSRSLTLGYVVRGVVSKRTSPLWRLWDLGPPNGRGKNVGHIFPYESHRDTLAVFTLSTLCPVWWFLVGGLCEVWEWATGSRVGSFRPYRSVLRDRVGKADLGQSRAQKASQESDTRICHSGRRTEKNEPSVTSAGPRTPGRQGEECGSRFLLRVP